MKLHTGILNILLLFSDGQSGQLGEERREALRFSL